MPKSPPRGKTRLPKFVRIIRVRPRLFTSLAIGVLIFLALSFVEMQIITRALLAWNVSVVLYLVLAFRLAVRSEGQDIQRRAKVQDDGKIAILILTAGAAFASLAAIFALLGTPGGATRQPAQLFMATATIVLSWAFTHTTFGLHYAHEFYDERSGKGGGLEFPGDMKDPDYLDFLYFSFVIGMCAQVSDITVSARSIRRTVFAHSVIAFVFNAALLALTVNIAASALSGSGN
jgi:uncharacterized membrane protein